MPQSEKITLAAFKVICQRQIFASGVDLIVFISSPPSWRVWREKELRESSSRRRRPQKPRLAEVKRRGNDSSASWRAGEKRDKKIELELDLPS